MSPFCGVVSGAGKGRVPDGPGPAPILPPYHVPLLVLLPHLCSGFHDT